MHSLRQNAFRALQRDLSALEPKTGSAGPRVAVRQLAPTLAHDLGPAIAANALSNSETALAFEILERVASELETAIRAELSRQIAASPLLPRRLALQFARDLDAIAMPMIEVTQAFTSGDLREIAETGSQGKLAALGRRAEVSEEVAAILIERGDAPAVETLLGNPRARLSEPALERAVERFGEDPGVQRALVTTRALPPSVAVKLVETIAGALLDRLAAQVQIPEPIGESLRSATEAAALGTALAGGEDAAGAAGGRQDKAVRRMLKALATRGKLTPLLVLRLAAGRRPDLVAEALTVLAANQPLPAKGGALEEFLLHGDAFRRRRIFAMAGMPAFLFSAFNAALTLMQECGEREQEGAAPDRAAFQAELQRRLVTLYREVSPGRDRDTALDETLERLARAAKDNRG
jgi:uncharacterized protein (DUF2336 family)